MVQWNAQYFDILSDINLIQSPQISINSNWIKTTEDIWGGSKYDTQEPAQHTEFGGMGRDTFSADFLKSLCEQEVEIGLTGFCNVG